MPQLVNEPLAPLTTFRTGGSAECLVSPRHAEEAAALCAFCHKEGVPLFVMGGGSNLLVSDQGIPGVTLSTVMMNRNEFSENRAILGAGSVISDRALDAARKGLVGLHFFYGMPGSVGGAVYMNARCYDREIADLFVSALVFQSGTLQTVAFEPAQWGYKRSPFQKGAVILEAEFRLDSDDPDRLVRLAEGFRMDREEKGHYRAPCAGSVFKNNRDFGEPSGRIIERCGLKGLTVGGARVSEWHANIIINTGNARSSDIMELIRLVRNRVYAETGFELEPEVVPAGDWEDAYVAGA